MLGRQCEEISVVGGQVHRLLSMGRRLYLIEITFNTEGFVQPSSVFQVQFVRVVNFEANLQV